MRLTMLKRPWMIAVGAIVTALVVAACGGGDPTPTPRPTATAAPQPTATSASQPTAVPGATSTPRPRATATPRPVATTAPTATPAGPEPNRGGTLKTRNIFDWSTWDTWHVFGGFSSMLTMNMFSNLIHPDLNDATALVGDLATSWEVTDDAKTYTLKIRPGVDWHDGVAFVAEDVVWNLERGMNSEDPFIGFNRRTVSVISSLEAPDAETVVIRLSQTSAGFLQALGAHSMLMYPPHVAGVVPKDGAVGTGPFRAVSYVKDNRLEMEANQNYYKTDEAGRPLPYVDAQTSFVLFPTAALAALRTGEIDCGCGFDHDVVTAAAETLRREGLKVELKLADQFNLMFNFRRAPFDNQRVRQAFSMLLDRRSLVLLPRGGFGEFPPNHMHPPAKGGQWGLPEAEIVQMPGFREPFSDEVAEANKILDEEGIDPRDLDLVFQGILSPNVDPYHIAAHSLLLNSTGASIDLRQDRGGAFSESMAALGWDISMSTGGTSYDDPNANFIELVSSNGARNRTGLDYGIDGLAAQQDATLDPAQRRNIVHEIMRKLINDATFIPSVWQVDGYATQGNVEGYIPPQLSVGPHFRLERLWFNDL